MSRTESVLIFFLYWAVRVIGSPLLLCYFLYRVYQNPAYVRNFAERLGFLPSSFQRTAPGSIWLHAVSVGEVISSVQLVEALRRQGGEIPVYVSTATLAGRAVAEQKLRGIVDGVFYCPVDYAFAVKRVLQRIRPAVVVILETEIWPMLYRQVKHGRCGLLILNGRMSDRTAGKYRRWRWVFRSVLSLPDALFVQTERDRKRYIDAGAPEAKVKVGGNLKYDARPSRARPPAIVAELLHKLRPTAVWIAASTMPGLHASDVDEDDAVLRAFQEVIRTHPALLLILAPRRPERFPIALQKLVELRIPFLQRSSNQLESNLSLPCVLLLDTIGELAPIFPYADVVFMGGTLASRGGHNVLEPASCGKAIVAGPHMENFAAIAEDFRKVAAWVEIPNQDSLASAINGLLDDSDLRATIGLAASELAFKQSGVAERAAGEVLRAQDRAIPDWNRSGLLRPLLWCLALLWRWGGYFKQKQDLARIRTLDSPGAPVISVGGIAMGGSGKTPFVEMLARKLHEQGLKPAVLTRGYRRRSAEKAVLVEAGSDASGSLTGDEAQIFVRSKCAHVGIGADRWFTGNLLQETFHSNVFLLDDGFQHRRLARNLDIVLIDGLDPFPGNAVFPSGFLREPLEALGRADAFVITRTQSKRRYEGIRERLHALNPQAPVLTARVEPRYWVDERTKQPVNGIDEASVAFCGLANPATFGHTLATLGVAPVFSWAFSDHHHYRPRELRRLAQQARSRGATILVTTEKDAMNLPENTLDLLGDLKLYWLKIATVVQEEKDLLNLIRRHVEW